MEGEKKSVSECVSVRKREGRKKILLFIVKFVVDINII